MFNMQKVGKKIIEHRKRLNMTQTELADIMNISFQAVSNWERGNSMPDISKLPELAKLFNVSVDELLGENSELVNFAITDDLDKYIAIHKISLDELNAHIPILKPDQLEIILGASDISVFDEVESFLPYLNEDTVNMLVLKRYEKGESIESLLPFMGEKAVLKLVVEMMRKNESVDYLYPFMADEDLEQITLGKISDGESFEHMLPLLRDESLRE